jgi:hypothetical protein
MTCPPPTGATRRGIAVMALAMAVAGPGAVAGQDVNVTLAAEDAETRFSHTPFHVVEYRALRHGGRTRLAGLLFADSVAVWAKWAPAPRGGAADNAEPRYEVAAYRLQKLFLDEPDYVVPPTAVRVVPIGEYPESGRTIRATFPGADAILVVLQLWLREVTSSGTWDERRLLADSVYARHVANTNILTHLIQHGDANVGNFLISLDPDHPRVFSVDNGIAFSSRPNPAAHEWRDLRVSRLPAGTVERLREIRPEDVEAALGVVIQLRVRDGALVLVEPGSNFDPGRAVRRRGDDIQLGLTAREIQGVQQRLAALLHDVDRGRIGTF